MISFFPFPFLFLFLFQSSRIDGPLHVHLYAHLCNIRSANCFYEIWTIDPSPKKTENSEIFSQNQITANRDRKDWNDLSAIYTCILPYVSREGSLQIFLRYLRSVYEILLVGLLAPESRISEHNFKYDLERVYESSSTMVERSTLSQTISDKILLWSSNALLYFTDVLL